LVWFGLVWFGLVWFGLVWFGLVWFGRVLQRNRVALSSREPAPCPQNPSTALRNCTGGGEAASHADNGRSEGTPYGKTSGGASKEQTSQRQARHAAAQREGRRQASVPQGAVGRATEHGNAWPDTLAAASERPRRGTSNAGSKPKNANARRHKEQGDPGADARRVPDAKGGAAPRPEEEDNS
jgi:hypothetical protein